MENARGVQPPVQNPPQPAPDFRVEAAQRQGANNSQYHVHPNPAPVPVQQAFQAQEANMFHPKGLRPYQERREGPILGRALCLTSKDSPVPGRVSHLNEKFQDSVTMYADTEELVRKISSMFPTVNHTHIRILLKKYYNREAVVISALQVEKHPIATPGPLTMSPSAARLHMGAAESLVAMLKKYGMPVSGCLSPRLEMIRAITGNGNDARPWHPEQQQPLPLPPPQVKHSPKMKLKYLKSVFPKAEETFIWEVLTKNENSVQMASQDLEAMGYEKKNIMQQPIKKPTPPPVKKVVLRRTLEDRQHVFEKLQRKFWSVPERLIMIALESVEYNEERADHILAMLLQEHTSPIMNRAETQQRPCEVDLPGEAWFPKERRAPTPPPPTAQAPPSAPEPVAYAVVPAYLPATVAVPGQGYVRVLVPVHAYVPMYAPAHVNGHAPAHVPASAQQYANSFAPTTDHDHGAAFISSQAARPVHVQPHPHVYAQAAASAHAAPHARTPRMWNEPNPVVNVNLQREVNDYQSLYANPPAGPNPAMRRGPQDNLLLEDYMPWNGPNPELRMGQAGRPVGGLEQQGNQIPLARGPSGIARGPSGLAQGPSGAAQGPSGIARGPMYRNRN